MTLLLFARAGLRESVFYYEAQQTGLFARKDDEMLLRDRLIEQTQVAPVLRRIDLSIGALAAALVLSLTAAEVLVVVQGDAAPTTMKTLSADDARRFVSDRDAGGGVGSASSRQPAYCDSPYYKSLAQGGVGSCGT